MSRRHDKSNGLTKRLPCLKTQLVNSQSMSLGLAVTCDQACVLTSSQSEVRIGMYCREKGRIEDQTANLDESSVSHLILIKDCELLLHHLLQASIL